MSWITPADAQTALEAALSHRPELLERYRAFYGSFWEDGLVPRQILELCRLRIAAIHDCDAEWQVRDAQVELTPAQLAGLRSGRFDAFAEDQRRRPEVRRRLP